MSSAASDWFHRPLQQILQGVEPEVFAQQIFAQQPLHLPVGAGGSRFGPLFGWEALSALLNGAKGLKLRIHQNQMNFFFDKEVVNFSAILTRLRQGGTLILEAIDRIEPQLARFADALSDEIAAEVHVNLYLSYPGSPGYPIHFDTHDFFILQIEGVKKWEIYPSTTPYPLEIPAAFHAPDLYSDDVAGQPPGPERLLQRLSLRPGDVLYVPKGYWHQALAEGGLSLHLTVGIHKQTGLDFVQWLGQQLRSQTEVRKPFPWIDKAQLPGRLSEPSPYAEQAAAVQQALLALLQQPGLLNRFHQDTYAGLERRQAFALPYQYAQQAAELAPYTHFRVCSVPWHLLDNEQGLLELVYPKTRLNYALPALELLRFLFQQGEFTQAELQNAFPNVPWPLILEVLLPLVQDGIVVPMSAETSTAN